MSFGVDFERYQFDRRLKELQDKVLSLNYRAPQDQIPQSIPSNEPQFLNNQYYPKPIYYTPQLQYQNIPNQQQQYPYFQYVSNKSEKQKKNENLDKETKKKQKEILQQQQLQKLEENLSKRQELMIANMKKDILDYIDPYIYGQYHNYYSYLPYWQQQQYYYNNNPIYNQSQVPLYNQNPPFVQFQPDQLTNLPISSSQQFQRIGQQSMQKIDDVFKGI